MTLGNADPLAGLSFWSSSHRSTVWACSQNITAHPCSLSVPGLPLVHMGPGNPAQAASPRSPFWAQAWKRCVRQWEPHSSIIRTALRNITLGNTSLTRTQLVLQRQNNGLRMEAAMQNEGMNTQGPVNCAKIPSRHEKHKHRLKSRKSSQFNLRMTTNLGLTTSRLNLYQPYGRC